MISMRQAFFDYAAATPMSESVTESMQPYFARQFYNPSALYIAAQDVRRAVQAARTEVASILGCRVSEVIFTAGGTESTNLAVHGVMQKFPGKNCIVSAVEHEAVLEPAKQYINHVAPVAADGRVIVEDLEALINDDTVLVSVMYANNEIGTIQPIREVAKLIKQICKQRQNAGNFTPLYFHSDAAQATNYLPLLVNSLGVDMMTLNGGKIYGPKQSGILYAASHVELTPQILGGGQERGIRSGTENVGSIIGFSQALSEAVDMQYLETKRLSALRDEFISKILGSTPNASLNGSKNHRLANNIHLSFRGCDNERLMMELDERGFMVATGSACSASNDQPSHVLRAIGLSDTEARSSLRITLGRQTNPQQLEELSKALLPLVASQAN